MRRTSQPPKADTRTAAAASPVPQTHSPQTREEYAGPLREAIQNLSNPPRGTLTETRPPEVIYRERNDDHISLSIGSRITQLLATVSIKRRTSTLNALGKISGFATKEVVV